MFYQLNYLGKKRRQKNGGAKKLIQSISLNLRYIELGLVSCFSIVEPPNYIPCGAPNVGAVEALGIADWTALYKQLATVQPSGTPCGHIYTRRTINLGFYKRLVFML